MEGYCKFCGVKIDSLLIIEKDALEDFQKKHIEHMVSKHPEEVVKIRELTQAVAQYFLTYLALKSSLERMDEVLGKNVSGLHEIVSKLVFQFDSVEN